MKSSIVLVLTVLLIAAGCDTVTKQANNNIPAQSTAPVSHSTNTTLKTKPVIEDDVDCLNKSGLSRSSLTVLDISMSVAPWKVTYQTNQQACILIDQNPY